MRIIAFIIEAGAWRDILTHLGEPTSPPRLMPARAPPLWERQGATTGEDDPRLNPLSDLRGESLATPLRNWCEAGTDSSALTGGHARSVVIPAPSCAGMAGAAAL
jgi:hypothetical protein